MSVINVSIERGVASLPDGRQVNLLNVQQRLAEIARHLGNEQCEQACEDISMLTGLRQLENGCWAPHEEVEKAEGWTPPHANPFDCICTAAVNNGTPDDFKKAQCILMESMAWTSFNTESYLDDLLQEIAGATGIVVQYLPDGRYRARYSE